MSLDATVTTVIELLWWLRGPLTRKKSRPFTPSGNRCKSAPGKPRFVAKRPDGALGFRGRNYAAEAHASRLPKSRSAGEPRRRSAGASSVHGLRRFSSGPLESLVWSGP